MRQLGKYFCTALLSGFILIVTAFPCSAGNAVSVAVLPFKINAQKDLGFLQDGILDMLSSRLSWKDKVRVVDESSVESVLSDIEGLSGESLALLAGGKLEADYVLYGSVTIVAANASIDAKMVDVTGKNEPLSFFRQASGLGNVIPEINRVATEINARVFNRQVASRTFASESAARSRQDVRQAAGPDSGFVSPGGGQPGTVPPNRNFISYTRAASSNGSMWQSRKFSHVINGIAVGDVDGDGQKETVIISEHYVHVYQASRDGFAEIAKTAKSRVNYYIGVDVADINGNGVPEIFVTSLSPSRDRVNSFVLEHNGGEYAEIVHDVDYYFRVVNTPSNSGNPVLFGQEQKKDADPFLKPVYEMKWENGNYVPHRKVVEEETACVTGTAYGDIMENQGRSIAAFNKKDHIVLLNQASKEVWESQDRYGGSLNSFVTPPEDPTNEEDVHYLPLRLLTADTNGDGTPEVITASNYDIARGILKRFRQFKKGHIVALSWNGLSMEPIWKTRALSGRVSDFFIGDFDNDGTDELIISYVSKDGFFSFADSESFLVGYDLFNKN